MTQVMYDDEETLRELYWEKGMSLSEMAEELDCSDATVLSWMDRYDIPRRSKKEYPALREKETLKKWYVDDELSSLEIADRVGCSDSAVRSWLKKHNIEMRTQNSYPELNDGEYLRKKYIDEWLTMSEIADEIGCSLMGVQQALDRFGIESRGMSDYASNKPASFWSDRQQGYEYWNAGKHMVGVHRLLAVAEYGFEAVKDKHVHHKKPIPWLNTPDNIVPVTAEEHTNHHLNGCEVGGDSPTSENSTVQIAILEIEEDNE